MSRTPRLSAALVRYGAPAAFALLVLAVWEIYVRAAGVRESTLPAPTGVLKSLWTNRSLLWDAAWTTIGEIALGYLLAIALGVGLAALLRRWRIAERAIYPWLVASQMVPVPAIAPIIVVWTGFDIRPKVIVIALVCFFPITVNAVDGLRAAEPAVLDLFDARGASPWQRFTKALFPAALPFLFSGLRIAAALSVIGAVFAEWVGSSDGLGYLILQFDNQAATTDMFGVIVVLSLIGLVLFGLVAMVERVALPWYHRPRDERIRT